MNKLLTLLIVIFMIFGCGENFTDKNTTNSTEQGGSNTGDNTGSGSDSDNTGDNTGDGSDSGDTGDNTGDGSDSGDTGDNTGDGSDSGDTGDNTGDGSDSGNTGDNTGNGSDSGDTGDNTGDGSDSGNTDDNTGDGSDSGDTGDNTGNGSDSGNTGDNTGGTGGDDTFSDHVTNILIKGCENTLDEYGDVVKSCEKEITELSLDLTDKVSDTIMGEAEPQNAVNRLVYYTVEPSNLAVIDSNGYITAKNTGSGEIIVSSDSNKEVQKSIPLTITNSASDKGESVPLEEIGFEEPSITIEVGETYQPTPKFTPANTTEREFECIFNGNSDVNYSGIELDKETCKITGKIAGKTTNISIKSKNNTSITSSGTKVSTVDKKNPLESFSVTPKNITLKKGDSFLIKDKFTITYNPADTSEKDIISKTSNEYVLYQRTETRFSAENIGSAILTVSSPFYPELKEEIIVKVEDEYYDLVIPQHNDINPSDAEKYNDRMYIKIMFDVFSSNGDIKNSEGFIGISQVDFQPAGQKGIELITSNMPGFLNNYGFCEKYGCVDKRKDNPDIASKSSGINYYLGNNQLYVPVRKSGKSTHEMYIVFALGSARSYMRLTELFSINWDEYNPEIHKNMAKFHIILKDRVPTITFDGFESK